MLKVSSYLWVLVSFLLIHNLFSVEVVEAQPLGLSKPYSLQAMSIKEHATFLTVAEVKKEKILAVGSFVSTLGYYSAGDGGGAYYVIENTNPGNLGYINHALENGLWLRMIHNGYINVLQGGMGNGATPATNSEVLQSVITILGNYGGTVYVPKGSYFLAGKIITSNTSANMTFLGDGDKSLLYAYDDKVLSSSYHFLLNFKGSGSLWFKNLHFRNDDYEFDRHLSMIRTSRAKYVSIQNCLFICSTRPFRLGDNSEVAEEKKYEYHINNNRIFQGDVAISQAVISINDDNDLHDVFCDVSDNVVEGSNHRADEIATIDITANRTIVRNNKLGGSFPAAINIEAGNLGPHIVRENQIDLSAGSVDSESGILFSKTDNGIITGNVIIGKNKSSDRYNAGISIVPLKTKNDFLDLKTNTIVIANNTIINVTDGINATAANRGIGNVNIFNNKIAAINKNINIQSDKKTNSIVKIENNDFVVIKIISNVEEVKKVLSVISTIPFGDALEEYISSLPKMKMKILEAKPYSIEKILLFKNVLSEVRGNYCYELITESAEKSSTTSVESNVLAKPMSHPQLIAKTFWTKCILAQKSSLHFLFYRKSCA